MRLEVITRKPAGRAKRTPLLFVHGAYGGAWIWDQHFLPWFAERGWEVHALSLRGHGESEGRESVVFARLRDYVDDTLQVLDDMPVTPVLIGHSLGGMIVQKVMHRRDLPAAVLMASAPPHGTIGTLFGMAFTNPTAFNQLSWGPLLGTSYMDAEKIGQTLFSGDRQADLIRRYMPRLEAESLLVNFDLLGLDLPPSLPTLDLPVLVLGAQNDAFIFPGALHATADTYRTEAEIFPDMAHAMMLERDWEKVAARIAGWLDATMGEGAAATAGSRAGAGDAAGAVG